MAYYLYPLHYMPLKIRENAERNDHFPAGADFISLDLKISSFRELRALALKFFVTAPMGCKKLSLPREENP